MKRPRRYYVTPAMPQGPFAFNADRGLFSVIVPLARTNLIANPSFETNTTGWTNTGGTTGTLRDTTVSYHGAYALSVIHNASGGGVYYAISLTAGTIYAFSLKINDLNGTKAPLYNMPGNNYKISIANNSGVDQVARQFKSNGRWQWVWVIFKATSTATHRLTIVRTDSAAGAFNIDGAQLEAITDGILQPTTYIDGDQQGFLVNQTPPPFGWTGTPHASTSYRLVTTRAGGYLMNLDRFGFRLLNFAGLGLAAVTNIAAGQAAPIDGERYQTSVVQARQFSLQGMFQAATPGRLQHLFSDLYDVIGPDSAAPRQPLALQYEPYDCDRPIGAFGRIVASYMSGLEGDTTPIPRDDATIVFRQWLPQILGGDSGAALTVQTSVSNANRILRRSADGTWSAMSTGASSNDVLAMAEGLDGKIYIGGRFADLGGVAGTNGIGYWDPADNAFHAMGSGVTSGTVSVNAVAVAPNGDVYVGGSFSLMNGVANTVRIARWNGSAWSALSTGVNGQVRALAFGQTGLLYLAGPFTNAGGVAAADGIASWDGSAYAALGTGTGGVGSVNALAVGPDGLLYAGGPYSAMGGVVGADVVSAWNGSTWLVLGGSWSGGGPTSVNALTIGTDAALYAGGDFTVAGGTAANNIARWNGSQWLSLGSGVNSVVFALTTRVDGMILAGGIFTTAGSVSLPDALALWNGSSWVALDVDLPSTANSLAVLALESGVVYVGFDTAGTATAAGLTTVTNIGSALAYPVVTITGPSSGTARVYQILNATTGRLLFLNLTINAGETVTLRTSPGGARMTSSFRGNITGAILPGSSGDFAQVKGDNIISFFSASSSVAALAQWTNAYQSVADLVD